MKCHRSWFPRPLPHSARESRGPSEPSADRSGPWSVYVSAQAALQDPLERQRAQCRGGKMRVAGGDPARGRSVRPTTILVSTAPSPVSAAVMTMEPSCLRACRRPRKRTPRGRIAPRHRRATPQRRRSSCIARPPCRPLRATPQPPRPRAPSSPGPRGSVSTVAGPRRHGWVAGTDGHRAGAGQKQSGRSEQSRIPRQEPLRVPTTQYISPAPARPNGHPRTRGLTDESGPAFSPIGFILRTRHAGQRPVSD